MEWSQHRLRDGDDCAMPWVSSSSSPSDVGLPRTMSNHQTTCGTPHATRLTSSRALQAVVDIDVAARPATGKRKYRPDSMNAGAHSMAVARLARRHNDEAGSKGAQHGWSAEAAYQNVGGMSLQRCVVRRAERSGIDARRPSHSGRADTVRPILPPSGFLEGGAA